MATEVRIAVLRCPGSFDYGALFAALLESASVTVYRADQGELPTAVYDAYLVTGSRHGTYDPDPWIAELIAYVASLLEQQRRVIGVCFGHQVLATALGGASVPNPGGWGVGRRSFGLTAEAEEALLRLAAGPTLTEAGALSMNYLHGDYVPLETLPEAVRPHVIGGTDHAPVLGLYCPGRYLSVQGHPEFTQETMTALIGIVEPRGVLEQLAEGDTKGTVLESLSRPLDNEFLGRAFVGFSCSPTCR